MAKHVIADTSNMTKNANENEFNDDEMRMRNGSFHVVGFLDTEL